MQRTMSRSVHRVYIGVFVLLVLFTLFFLIYLGTPYYATPLDERFYHPDHKMLKPSGAIGHGLGIVGTLLIIIGVSSYMIRKRVKRFRTVGVLKHWLEFHIFLCTIGPIMVLFHTSFKFGGVVSISFWSMVAVVLSGVIGRFIYIQIPRTIEGRELSLSEVKDLKLNIGGVLKQSYQLNEQSYQVILDAAVPKPDEIRSGFFGRYLTDFHTMRRLRDVLKTQGLARTEAKRVIKLVKHELSLNHKIERLLTMQKLFRYWHVAHLPFALIMLIIMVVHVGVTLAFGYRWIF